MLKPPSCDGCPISTFSQGFVLSEGEGTNGVVIIGEKAGFNEHIDSLPFRPYAQGGSKLEEVFKLVSKDTGQPCTRKQFKIYNAINCCPPESVKGELEQQAVAHCSPNVDNVINGFHTPLQKTIMALGNVPLMSLTGVSGVTGDKQSIFYLRGFVFESKYGLVVPSLHPNFVKRGNGHLTPLLVEDMKRALNVAKGLYTNYPSHKGYVAPVYQTSPGIDEAWSFYYKVKDSPKLCLSYDIETPMTGSLDEDERDELEEKEIILVQFSVQKGTGIALPYTDVYLPVIQKLFETENVKANHNCFARNTSVWMSDGSWKPIWSIKVGEKVKTCVKDEIVDSIVNSLFRTNDSRPWVSVKVDGAYKRGAARWGDTGTICTPDHHWVLNGGKRVRADNLKVGDEILLPQQGSRWLIEGCILGDGWTDHGLLKFSHSNYEWAKAKADSFGVNVNSYNQITDYTSEFSEGETHHVTAGVPKYWRDIYYNEDKTRKWIPPTGGSQTLAIWYGDDGCLSSDGKHATFALHKYVGQLEEIKLWFEQRYGGECSIHNDAVLYLKLKTSNYFFSDIAHSLHPSMYYKLPEEFKGRYDGWMEIPTAQIGKVISVGPTEYEVSRDHLKYCLTIRNTHTFFTRNGLVTNCWNFDNPRIRAKGIKINGKVHDTMWMFKHWHPKLPRGLQSVSSLFGFPFPWKHLYSSKLEWYGCADVDAVQWIVHALPKLMKAKGVWSGYIDHVYNIHPILDRASVMGIPVSEDKRIALDIEFKGRRKEIHKELQGNIPDEIRNIRPRRAVCDENGEKVKGEWDYGYIREPKTVGIEFETYKRLSERLRREGKSIVSFEDFIYRKHNLTSAEFTGLDERTGERLSFNRWCVVEDFKASSTQLIRYLRWKQEQARGEAEQLRELRQTVYGGKDPDLTARIKELEELTEDYEVPQNLKTKKETTSKGELEEMFINTGDPVLERVVRIRSYDTNITNFIPNWKPSRDGRVHTTWGFTAPSGQFDARRPNILNCSKHTEFGNEFRGIIEAPKGRVFVEFDKKSFHVGTLGYCANDKTYIRFSQIDPHSILGSYIDPSIIGGSISLKWSDSDIKTAAGEFKKRCKMNKAKDPLHNMDVRQELAKPTVLGNQLELGPKKLQRQNRRFIEYVYKSQRLAHKGVGYSAEELQNIINELFPKEQLYKSQIKEKAHIEKFLINEFGRIQYFYDVFNFSFQKKIGKWGKKDGEGAREPIAFRVHSTAFGMIDDELLECERQGLCEEHWFCNSIHDSLVFLPEVGKKDKCIEAVYEIMNRPCKKLVNEATGPEGLKISVEVAVGRNWKGWHQVDNEDGMKEIKI